MNKLQRALHLLMAFQRNRSLATRDVMRILGVDRQTAVRDLHSLQDAGIPVGPVGEGSERRWVLDGHWKGDALLVTQGDVFALHFGRQLLGFVEGTALSDWLEELHQKLEVGVSARTQAQEDRFARRLVYLSEPYRPYGAKDEALDEILTALLADRELTLEYRSRAEARRFERLWPLALVIYRRALYLIARLPGRDRDLRFAVDRVISARRRPEPFPYPEDYDPRAALERSFGIFDDGGAPERVRLRFDPEVADLVHARVWHPTARTWTEADGAAILELQAQGPELVRLVLEWGARVRVLEPASLRRRVTDELRAALAAYPEETEAELNACSRVTA